MNDHNNLLNTNYDLLLMTFVEEFKMMLGEGSVFTSMSVLAAAKGIQVNERAVEFLPYIFGLYVLWAHKVPFDSHFKDLSVNKKEIEQLMRAIDFVRDKAVETAETMKTQEQGLSKIHIPSMSLKEQKEQQEFDKMFGELGRFVNNKNKGEA